jgi:hypothetical protein
VPDPNHPNDPSIPVLTDVLVSGDAARVRSTRPQEPEAAPPAAGAVAQQAEPAPAAGAVAQQAEPPPAAGAVAQQAEPPPTYDADLIAERLRGRFANYLTGDGRGIIEARCRDALQEHTSWLVSQITREVALALETEVAEWVREAVKEEIARRSAGG